MNDKDLVLNEYFQWLMGLIYHPNAPDPIDYSALLVHLFNREFIWTLDHDSNRAINGIDLRSDFSTETTGFDRAARLYLGGPCSILEMLIALSKEWELIFMSSPEYDYRGALWFWEMIENLGLIYCTDNNYDEKTVDGILDRFIFREYESNGKGGLFVVDNSNEDLRHLEIWVQLCMYINYKIFKKE